jgi:hypothetical protein
MDTTPALDAALSGGSVIFFVCGKADLPGYTLRLLDGASSVTWAEGTFVGRDPTFGVMSAIEPVTDGVGDQAPMLGMTLLPPSEAAAASLAAPGMQGSRLRIWLGALDLTTKAVIADPYLIFDGELDQPTLTIDRGTRELDFECVSSFEKLFRNDEGHRLSQAHHQEIWPGETGLADVTGVVKQVLWGPGDKIAGSFPGAGGGSIGGGNGGGFDAPGSQPGSLSVSFDAARDY